MSINFTFLFYLKKPKAYTLGPVPIYLRVTVAGKRAELVTGRECDPGRWSSAAGRATGTKAATKGLARSFGSASQTVDSPRTPSLTISQRSKR